MGSCNREPQTLKLFAALAVAAARRLSELNTQNVANIAWTLATVNYRDDKLCATWRRAAERAFVKVNQLDEKLFRTSAWEALRSPGITAGRRLSGQ